MKVAILGCGPAGLLAAHATAQNRHIPLIFSQKRKSAIGGAQYVHEHIPGLNVTDSAPHGYVLVEKHGTEEGYAKKVYGDSRRNTSWNEFLDGAHLPAWDIRAIYDELWHRYMHLIANVQVSHDFVQKLVDDPFIDRIINTVPLKVLCRTHDPDYAVDYSTPHQFAEQEVVVAPEALMAAPSPHYMIYDGTDERSWYRCSNLFGYGSTEWGYVNGRKAEPPIPGTMNIAKPLHTNCDCFANEVFRVGRYGRWKKGVLVHHAFQDVLHVLDPWLDEVQKAEDRAEDLL